MLTSITLHKVATYTDSPQVLSPLRTVNLIYGDNGSGKSTIAQYISRPDSPRFSYSELEWDAIGPCETLVYDRIFVDETLRETKVKGVFTLGEGAGTKQDELESKIEERNKLVGKIQNLATQTELQTKQQKAENDSFNEKCWNIQKKYRAHFGEAFQGFLGSKENFKIKCTQSIDDINAISFEELHKQASSFLSNQPDKISLIPFFHTKELRTIEESETFKIKIIGKEDVPIAGLIKKLGNSDWVRQGLNFLTSNTCPFCQQSTPSDLRKSIESYFDETFTKQISLLNISIQNYCTLVESTIYSLERLKEHDGQFFKYISVQDKITIIKSKLDKNKELLTKKLHEPSISIDIESICTDVHEITKAIDEANSHIKNFNLKVDNFATERKKLIAEIWRFVGSLVKADYDDHTARLVPINAALSSIAKKMKEFSDNKKLADARISDLQKSITSISPSKDGINNILNSFGFNNFRIVEDANEGYYRILREDGTPAQENLSEGERTFITFLYFYQLIQGSTSKDQVAAPRIVVFDDPVSSLDSKILFIVSQLILKLFSKSELKKLNIRQLFIMTHNVYFHKEVSFPFTKIKRDRDGLKNSDCCFWIVRKQNCISTLSHHKENPIKTNYQLLWQEVKRCEENPKSSVHICNTLRRILENYFTVLGGIDISSLTDCFDGDEKFVCRSLTSWIHDGSHCMYDGLDVGFGQDLTDHYLPVFRKIFEKTKHTAHYDMMMNS